MSNELFYLIFTPVVFCLFVYASYCEKEFQKAKRNASSLSNLLQVNKEG